MWDHSVLIRMKSKRGTAQQLESKTLSTPTEMQRIRPLYLEGLAIPRARAPKEADCELQEGQDLPLGEQSYVCCDPLWLPRGEAGS